MAYDDYWRFSALRQQRFIDTLYNIKSDHSPILSEYKFTNCYRVLDRTSQYLVRQITSDDKQSPANIFFRTIIFKVFNKIETWEALEKELGPLTIENFNEKHYANTLTTIKKNKLKIYSAAYIMPSGKREWGSAIKHENNLRMIRHMLSLEMHNSIWDLNHLKRIYEMFLKIPSIGRFLAYQYATDIAYSSFSDALECQFVMAGPGAKRGIIKCFPRATEEDFTYIIEKMAAEQEHEFKRLELSFIPIKNRPLQLIDCQNIFCEVDKYLRVKRPELGKPGSRIKQLYKPNTKPIDYCLPKKWNADFKLGHHNANYI